MNDDALPDFEQQAMLLDEWVEARRQAAAWEAKAAGLLAQRAALMERDVEQAPLHRDTIWRSMVAEYSAAGRMAKGAVEHAFTDARSLAADFPTLRSSFEAGLVSPAHVREIVRAAFPVTQAIVAGTVEAATLAVYEAAAVEFAEVEAPARTRAHVREIAAALAGVTVVERHKAAVEERSVTVRSVGDGLALLQAIVPEYQAQAIMDRLTTMARHQKTHPEDRVPVDPHLEPPAYDGDAIFGADDTFTIDPFGGDDPAPSGAWVPAPAICDDAEGAASYRAAVDRMLADGPQVEQVPGETRTLDQIRADLFTDLLLTADPSEIQGSGLDRITARIQVTVAATTLVGADDRPAQLDGHGPLDPDVARRLAGGTTGWTRLFLDPQGMVTESDTYTPPESMRRFLHARDEHCRFTGCRMPVHRCDLDHTLDYAKGGKTSTNNLAHLCRAHHALKHPDVPDLYRWNAVQLPDGTLEWTSPLGRKYTDRPPRRVMFVPSGPPEWEQGSADVGTETDVEAPAPF
ncbi:DUF222 domain-containing protein [Microbacterium sp. NPDC058345]|uniref:HNH endonuclease n=1 Tax=Microbacterium sp. NPDC058345 TaxID=3346455 RepID=UPI003664CB68